MHLTWSILSAVGLSIGLTAFAPPAFSDETSELEKRVRSAPVEAPRPAVPAENWQKPADAVEKVLTASATASACGNPKVETFGGKYAIAFDGATGEPCKLYDLSFPTLATLAKGLKVSTLPTQRFTSRDYLDWINGNASSVQRRMSLYQGEISPMAAGEEIPETAAWVSDLKFRENNTLHFAVLTPGAGIDRLPKSFRASDLDIGTKFVFNERDRALLKNLIASTRHTGVPEETVQMWQLFADQPAAFLNKIHFDWNDARKAYDIALDGDFLPLGGPVTLVDFRTPYKPAVERMVRGILGSALLMLTRAIPHPTIQNIVHIAIDDTFDFVEQMYTYHNNQLEDTLRAGMSGATKMATDQKATQKTLNLLFGSQSDFMSSYVMSLAQGQKFNWEAIEKIGARTRYASEKGRDVTMNDMNSRLVLKGKCSVTPFHDYFGVCSKAGQPNALHSLISKNTVLFWNLGAPMIHRYSAPAEVSLKRGTSYLLSVGVRLFDTPVPRSIVRQLGLALKGYARAGVADEAFLRNSLWLEKQEKGALDMQSQELLFVLYRQNMNPFLPNSEAAEAKIIRINTETLTAKVQQGVVQ